MSVRLFAGYFLALAACATIAFSTTDTEASSPSMDTAGFMPADFTHSRTDASARRHRIISQHFQMAQAE